MATYKTPGVYVEEVSIFPPSVAEVETAIPAFIGYTEMAEEKGTDLTNVPTKIASMLEYEGLFGGAPAPESIAVTLDNSNNPAGVDITPRFYLYQSLQLFFDNGGGDCYIVSVGSYDGGTVDLAEMTGGLNALKKYDEPTIILFPDAMRFGSAGDLYTLQQRTLAQCATLQDRVAVFDVYQARATDATFDLDDGVQEFRDNIGVNNLKYGAAYVPHLRTRIPYAFEYADVDLQRGGSPLTLASLSADPVPVERLDTALGDRTTADDFVDDPLGDGNDLLEGYEAISATGRAEVVERVTYIDDVAQAFLGLSFTDPNLDTAYTDRTDAGAAPNYGVIEEIVRTLNQYDSDYYDGSVTDDTTSNDALGIIDPSNYGAYDLSTDLATQDPADTIYHTSGNPGDDETARAANARDDLRILFEDLSAEILSFQGEVHERVRTLEQEVKSTNAIYANVVRAIQEAGSTLPPSGAVAGIYAFVDDTRGVFKAPANVSLSSVAGPTVVIDDADQEDLNIDTNGGKSINAIRAFTGRGVLVWGARTLAGNDNEWRYVPVRRFFNMVEESVKKSTSWAVFEPNDATLWTKVKGMIENYLIQKWQEGALQGAKPEDAFFVQVGLGRTMTPQDILEGRLRVKIGMAVVRPAEFIILEFSHKLAES